MSLTRLKAGAVVLLASCSAAGCDGVAQGKGRIFTPDTGLVYVNVYTTDPDVDREALFNFANDFVMPRLTRRIQGMGVAAILGNRTSALRIRPNPDRLRAHSLSSRDIMRGLMVSSMIGPGEQFRRISHPAVEIPQSKEYVLTYFGKRFDEPEQYGNVILKASPEGEILRLKEVCEVELSPHSIDIRPEINGRPAAAIVLKPLPGRGAAGVVEAVREELEQAREGSFPPGMDFEIISPEDRGMIYAVIETPWNDYPLEYTGAVCRELEAIATGIDDIASVSSMAGYDIRTEGRSPHAGTCLIRLKDRPGRKPTPRQVIEKIEEKCRTRGVDPECFEPPAISAFVAAGGFSVRVLDVTNAIDDGRPGGAPATSMDDLLNRKELEGVFAFLAGNYPQHELIINNDAAIRQGVSIASALEELPRIVDGDVPSERTLRRFVEDPSNLSIKNDRGELIPYRSFMRFEKKQGLNAIDR